MCLKIFQIRLVSIKDTGSKSSTRQPGRGIQGRDVGEGGLMEPLRVGGSKEDVGWGEAPGGRKSHRLIEGIIRRLLINLPLF